MVTSDIFQSKMMQLMHGLEEFVRTYLDDLLLIHQGSFKDHLDQLDEVLKRLASAGVKINAKKYNFFGVEFEYLGF